MSKGTLLVVLSAFIAVPPVVAQLNSDAFVQKAVTAGMTEVQLGNMAAQKSTNSAVKSFAEHMVTDHSKANQELEALAKKDNINVPTQVQPDQKAAADNLNNQSGVAFDRAYVTQAVQNHQAAVALFKTASKDSSLDQNLRAFAEKTLPTLERHMAEAEQLNAQVNGPMKQSER